MVFGLHTQANKLQEIFDKEVKNNFKRIVEIDVGQVSTFDFHAKNDVKSWLVLKGFEATTEFFGEDQWEECEEDSEENAKTN